MNKIFAPAIIRAFTKTADSYARMITARSEGDNQLEEHVDVFISDLTWLAARCQADDTIPYMIPRADDGWADDEDDPVKTLTLVSDYVNVNFANRDSGYIDTGRYLFEELSHTIQSSLRQMDRDASQ